MANEPTSPSRDSAQGQFFAKPMYAVQVDGWPPDLVYPPKIFLGRSAVARCVLRSRPVSASAVRALTLQELRLVDRHAHDGVVVVDADVTHHVIRAGDMISGTASGRERAVLLEAAATPKQLPRRFRSSTLRVCGAGRLALDKIVLARRHGARIPPLSVASGLSLVWPNRVQVHVVGAEEVIHTSSSRT